MNVALRKSQTVVAFPEPTPQVRSETPPLFDHDQLLEMIQSIGHPDLRDYCIDQIKNAGSSDDVAAVVELVVEVTRKRA